MAGEDGDDLRAPAQDWLKCTSNDVDCRGIQFGPYARCLAHLSANELEVALGKLGPGKDLDARGTTFTADLTLRVLSAFKRDDGRYDIGKADLEQTRFMGATDFESLTFLEYAAFRGATFECRTSFVDCRFSTTVDFSEAVFRDRASFYNVNFDGWAWFTEAQFHGDFSLGPVQFGDAANIGPVAVARTLWVSWASFSHHVTVQASARRVDLDYTSFDRGATLRLRYAEISLSHLTATLPVTVAWAPHTFSYGLHDPRTHKPGEWTHRELDERLLTEQDLDPSIQLISLREADASQVVFVDADLSECRFEEAQNLDSLRIQGRLRFGTPPPGFHIGWALLPLWRWTPRLVLAEERAWRLNTRKKIHWATVGTAQTKYLTGTRHLDAEKISATYRQLRKAQEDAKNEPGAADFYYGEMEMRRHAASSPRPERLILLLYWAVSGYGLRASRAIVALVLLLALGAAGFATVGFANTESVEYQPVAGKSPSQPVTYRPVTVPGPKPGWPTAIRHSIDSATSLLRSPASLPTTPLGSGIEIALRLLGPLLVGLAVLAVRNRVKR